MMFKFKFKMLYRLIKKVIELWVSGGPKLLVFDTETTGLKAGEDELLQFSAVDGNGNELMNQFLKPTATKEWPQAQAVNGISPEFVSTMPTVKEVRSKIQKLFDDADVVVGYNVGFDIGFVEAAGIKIPAKAKIVDVMVPFAKLYGEWNFFRNEYKWQKLVVAAKYFGFDWGMTRAHDSAADALATWWCYMCMRALGKL